jgi:hypothetical protein
MCREIAEALAFHERILLLYDKALTNHATTAALTFYAKEKVEGRREENIYRRRARYAEL